MTSTRRVHALSPAELDKDQRALYDEILGGPRANQTNSVPLVDGAGCLAGPFNAFLLQPAVGQPLQALGAALRYRTGLPARWRELAILIVAAHTRAEFEQYAHEPVARSLGLSDDQLAGIRAGDHESLGPDEAVVAGATLALLVDGDLSDRTFADLQALLGDAQLFELTALVGYYSLLATQLRVFRVPVGNEPTD